MLSQTQWVNLGRGWCWTLKSNQFQSQCHLSFVTEYVTMGIVKIPSLPHLVSLFLMSQISSLVWGLTLGLRHVTGQLPLSGFLLICHSDCMVDFAIPVSLGCLSSQEPWVQTYPPYRCFACICEHSCRRAFCLPCPPYIFLIHGQPFQPLASGYPLP